MKQVKNISDYFKMHVEGFKNLSKTGKTLWAIIILKLFIMFAVMKVFLFPNFLNSVAKTDEQKAEYVATQLTEGIENEE